MVISDLRYCLRSLAKCPGLVSIAVISLGVGIGLNLVVFGFFESMLIRGVTASDPAHTFHVWAGGSNRTSYPNYRDLRAYGAVHSLAAYSLVSFTLGDGDAPELIKGQTVAGDYFEMLGVQPLLGRGFTVEEKTPERDSRVMLISYPFWKQRFHSDPRVLGQTMRVNGQPFTIIGVLPEGYRSIHGIAIEPPLYVPYSGAVDANYQDRRAHPLELVMHIASPQTREQATAALLAAAKECERIYPNDNAHFGQVRVYGLSPFDRLEGGGKMALVFFGVLSAVVGMVLLIACANVAGLLLARGVQRRREVAIRLSIGGSRRSLIRLFLTEGLLLSAGGLAAAALIYFWSGQLMERLPLPLEVPVYLHAELNWRMALYSAVISALAAALCSFGPVLEAVNANVSQALKNELEAVARGRVFSLRDALVISQVAFSLLLLVTSLLFVRSLREVQTVDPGFNVENQLLVSVRVDGPAETGQSMKATAQLAKERLSKISGVRSVTDAFLVPLSRNSWITSVRVGNDRQNEPVVQANAVGERYFTTMGIRVLGGREFDVRDSKTSAGAVIVNQSFANKYFNGASPLGQVVTAPGPKGGNREPWEIVGVVADSKHESLGEQPTPVLYRPLAQEDLPTAPTIHVRTDAPASATLSTVRSVLRDSFPKALVEVKTMEDTIIASTTPNRIGAILLGVTGTLGLSLASVGLYGALAYAVSRRAREIGVRMALGASARQVLSMVIGQAMKLVGIGTAIGLALAMVATRPLAAFLSAGVSVVDPVTLASVVVVLTVTAFAAAVVPALQALRVDPMLAMRCD